MRQVELLAPARDLQIGIAAIDCGADAVYIAGPQFGARQAAGNPIEDIKSLCEYAHKFGVRIFVTLNTILYDCELTEAYKFMLQVQEAGADAIIVQDLAVMEMAKKGIGNLNEEIRIPLHASTQCAIRTPEQARFLESLGFSRLILERELSLDDIRAIRAAVSCELEFFVHGALCVCYSGQCYLSEMIAGRSANRGACIQACRSRYDLLDSNGKILVKDKALLSLKDYNLKERLEDLAEAGITSFKIEGRLKNESYVRNVVRDYSIALDRLTERRSGIYERGSFGTISGGFTPDTAKTFNRGYTELYIDGTRGKWASMEAAKAMGEFVGKVRSMSKDKTSIEITPVKGVILNNGDGFSFVARNGNVEGFRGDVCNGNSIKSKGATSLFIGASLYRNINTSFEKELARQSCHREISVIVDVRFFLSDKGWGFEATATSEDRREVTVSGLAPEQLADNQIRMKSMLQSQIGKSCGHYRFALRNIMADDGIPFMSASAINAIRRELSDMLDQKAVNSRDLLNIDLKSLKENSVYPYGDITYKQNVSNNISEQVYRDSGVSAVDKAYELIHEDGAELMRTRYCIKYELGLCPVHQGAKATGPLFLMNNGRRLALYFDCKHCEMVVCQK